MIKLSKIEKFKDLDITSITIYPLEVREDAIFVKSYKTEKIKEKKFLWFKRTTKIVEECEDVLVEKNLYGTRALKCYQSKIGNGEIGEYIWDRVFRKYRIGKSIDNNSYEIILLPKVEIRVINKEGETTNYQYDFEDNDKMKEFLSYLDSKLKDSMKFVYSDNNTGGKLVNNINDEIINL